MKWLPHMLLLSSMPFAAAGCKRDDMADQPRIKPQAASAFYANAAAARPLVSGTVTTAGVFNDDDRLPWTSPRPETAPLPFAPTLMDLHRGQEIFNIYCTPCHGYVGDGDGMIVLRGLTRPPSYHIDRLRASAPGHFYNVITDGWGAMYSFKDRIAPDDRWRVVAYIQALQLSQHAPANQLSADDLRALQAAPGVAHD